MCQWVRTSCERDVGYACSVTLILTEVDFLRYSRAGPWMIEMIPIKDAVDLAVPESVPVPAYFLRYSPVGVGAWMVAMIQTVVDLVPVSHPVLADSLHLVHVLAVTVTVAVTALMIPTSRRAVDLVNFYPYFSSYSSLESQPFAFLRYRASQWY